MIRDYRIDDVVTIGRNIVRRDTVAKIPAVNESIRYSGGYVASNANVADAINGFVTLEGYASAFEDATGVNVAPLLDTSDSVDMYTVFRKASDNLNRRNYKKPLSIDEDVSIVAELRADSGTLRGYVYTDHYGDEYPIATDKNGTPTIRKYGIPGLWRILAPHIEETLKMCASHVHAYNREHKPTLDKVTGWTLELVAGDFGLVK